MIEKFLNRLGLYTTKQLGKITASRLIQQAEDIKKITENEEQQRIEKINTSLSRLLQLYKFCRSDRYLSITPFVDSYNNYCWIITQIPQIDSLRVSGNIEVYSCEISPLKHNGYLYFDIFSETAGNYKDKTFYKPERIKIVDFVIEPQNRGIGSYLIKQLEQMATELGVLYITGYLSPRDYENREAQVRFYKRHGYKIKLNDTDKEGFIRKDLT